MKSWQGHTAKYFYMIVAAVLLTVVVFILFDSFRYRQVKSSLTNYMDNLRDMVFMSTYDSLKKGNMKLFKNHLEEIGTFGDVREFSLLDKQGITRYSSAPELVKKPDVEVISLDQRKELTHGGYTTYYFPVETLSYCVRCHPDWTLGSINSYYKLTLSRKALDTVKHTTFYSHGFTIMGGGVFLGFIYLLLTLYERRKHEEQIGLSASVFENAVEAIVITTFDGQVERINTAFSQITGFSAEDIIGQDIHILDAGEINADTYREMREQIKTNGLWSGELWNCRKGGESFPVRLSVTAVRNIHDQITHFVSVFYDISVKKASERALVEMDQIKSEFISTAAHELRTPLSAMMGFTELAREPEKFGGFTAEQIKDFLDEVYDKGEALNQLIDDLLDVSRIERGRPIALNLQEVKLTDVIVKVVEFYRVHDSWHTFKLDIPGHAVNSTCLIDRYRINQVLENLLNNAAKYSARKSEILLSCSLLADRWEISVEDHGIGMSTEQVERIFDKFYRANSSDSAVSGLGLGMSIAKQVVDLHGGLIWVKSALGKGTTVTFTLPRLSD